MGIGIEDLDEETVAEMPQGQRYQARLRQFGIPRASRAGSPENRTALVTSSETSNSAVAAVSLLIPRHESRNWRVYLRAQNGEVGNATKASVPAFDGPGLARPCRLPC